MILNLVPYGIGALVVLGLLYWLTKRAKTASGSEHLLKNSNAGNLLPKHYRFFPQVSRALSLEDNEYLSRRTSPIARKAARRVRRQIGLEFLRGLREDYSRLDQLARALTALAPAANPQRESERFWLAIQFKFSWYVIWASLWSGMAPIPQMQRLTTLVGAVTARLETALGAWQEISLSAPSAGLSA
jgi:hypothetical protein